uniref:Uncharacterized protein LOC111124408 n=1 Tax=Crassostrea virginica TaxID=6565 RepID=A0A8B8D4E7_CRAVI|nr:uncharacterized protein LOC111124408 [Crassostrea virginica]
MAECPSASCTIRVEDATEEEFSEMILIDEYKECESDENNNPDDLHAFDKIAALGEIGLDRTVSPKYWSRQDETFRKVLALADPSKPIILHLRGPVEDHIDSHYMSPSGKGCNTPAFIEDVASLVAAHRDVPATELLRQTSRNGYNLYGQ